MSLPLEPSADHSVTKPSVGSVATRIWDASKKLVTITDHLQTLEKEDVRLQGQVLELGRMVIDLAKEVRELSGQMKGIEKRFDDKDKMIEAVTKLRILEEVEKAMSKVDTKLMVVNP